MFVIAENKIEINLTPTLRRGFRAIKLLVKKVKLKTKSLKETLKSVERSETISYCLI